MVGVVMSVALPNVTAVRNGPGFLLSWQAVPGAFQFVVLRSRSPSLSFYELASSCCPVLPNGSLPCCPLPGARSSLQIEGLEPGIGYRFRVVGRYADGRNATSLATPAITAASLATAPSA